MLHLLIAESNQGFQGDLVSQPMIPGDLQNFTHDKTFHKAEHIGIGASLNLAQEALFILSEKIQPVDFGDAVREKFLGEIELTPPDDVFIDIPADFLGNFNTLGITLGFAGEFPCRPGTAVLSDRFTPCWAPVW
jgi:hypothetical protein